MKKHRTKILGSVFLLAGLALCAAGLRLLLEPAQYQATVRIRVASDATSIIGLSGPPRDPSEYDPYFIQTELEVIQSQVVLGKTVEALNLNTGWGKRYAGGSPLKTVESVNLLKRRLNVRLVGNTMLIEIKVTSEDPNEAATIANTVAEAYREFRLNQWRQLTLNGIQILTEEYESEEERIRVLQTNVDWLRTKYKINTQDEADFDNPDITLSKLMSPAEQEERKNEYERTKPFWDEKRKLTPLLEFHKLLKMKIESEKNNIDRPNSSMVEIIKAAGPPQTPVGPDRVLGALLFAIGLFPTAGGFLLLKASRLPSD